MAGVRARHKAVRKRRKGGQRGLMPVAQSGGREAEKGRREEEGTAGKQGILTGKRKEFYGTRSHITDGFL